MRVAVSVFKSLEWVTQMAEEINAKRGGKPCVEAKKKNGHVFLVPLEDSYTRAQALAFSRWVREQVPGRASVTFGDLSFYVWPEGDGDPESLEDAWATEGDMRMQTDDYSATHPLSGAGFQREDM